MDFIIKGGGKALVHCHAGQGRTALIIGAYLLYARIANNCKECVEMVQAEREKCFTKKYNVKFIEGYFKHLVELRQLFPSSKNKMELETVIKK
mmetsp:Transcript_10175/g.10155  ORF Transcript_10175/g.10155 Transcript_10175/m.10155 type:complete len:93 (-) Transcript_10175:488-766(-)